MAGKKNSGRSSEEIVGLDVSNGVISATRVAVASDGTLKLLNAGWTHVAPGATERDLVTAIHQVWRSASIPSRTVCVSLRSRSAMLRYFSYPNMDKVELASALGLEAENSLQLPRAQIALDWHLNYQSQGQAARQEGLLVAVPRKEVDDQMAFLRRAGLYPVAMEVGATAVGNLYSATHPDPQTREDVAVLHLSNQRADLALLFGGDSLYARTLHARGDNWEASLGSLMEGVQDALKYYVFKLRSQPVRQLMVSGRLPDTPDFMIQLRSKLGVAVDYWEPLDQIVPATMQARRAMKENKRPPLVVSLGLALRRYDGD